MDGSSPRASALGSCEVRTPRPEQDAGVDLDERAAPENAVAFFEAAQSLIRLAATGAAAPADEALPWPPPTYVTPARSAAQILASAYAYASLPCPRLPIGCQPVDARLNGGLPAGMVVEVSGKAGSGKTQFALSLVAETVLRCHLDGGRQDRPASANSEPGPEDHSGALSASLRAPPPHAGRFPAPAELSAEAARPTAVFYIHTEGGFPVRRLYEIMKTRRDRLAQGHAPGTEASSKRGNRDPGRQVAMPYTKSLMQQVFMEEVATEEELWITLTHRLPRLFLSYRVALIVIDSIAAVFRLPASTAEPHSGPEASAAKKHVGLVDRATKLMRVGAVLRRFAGMHRCCCLVLNQVSDATSEDDELCKATCGGSSGCGAPAAAQAEAGPGPAADEISQTETAGAEPLGAWRPLSEGIDGQLVWSARQVTPGPILFGGEDPGVRPALGHTWSNCVDGRLMIHKMNSRYIPSLDDVSGSGEGEDSAASSLSGGALRCLRVVFASGVDNGHDIFFKIDASGVVDP
ncbi:hypothetical protein BESB_024390 [Besnoitia besnoiti]|uniref:RecA family profile 1 domain-containing protein n=1 Tax=Besnoitia besnoiti TaxID=94643 RepID=A0A2A9M8I7_BESBE|nr:hypothetical protein BESB_024390 [Besnoitia besnoiti]PFH31947.1 hypothetical protein BESB_024390 [Besnoitia besnoiti]